MMMMMRRRAGHVVRIGDRRYVYNITVVNYFVAFLLKNNTTTVKST
jgi:hypothetical protein